MREKKKIKQGNKPELRQSSELYWKLAKPYKWWFAGVIVAALFYSLSHVIEKYLFKILIDNGTDFAAGNMAVSAFVYIVWIVLGVFFAALIVKFVSNWLKMHIMNRLENHIILDLKIRFFNHLIGLSHRFHTNHKTGSLISKLTRGARAVEQISDFITFGIVPVIMEILIVGVSILYFDIMSASMLVIISVIFMYFSVRMLNKQQFSRVLADNAEDREKAMISDVFTNIDSVKYFGKENRIKNLFARLAGDTQSKYLKNWDYYRNLEAGQSLILGLGVFLLLYFPFVKFLDGGISTGTLVFIYTIYFNLAGPLFSFVYGVRRFYEAVADLYALSKYDKERNEIEDMPNAGKMIIQDGEIEFDNVSFKYTDRRVIRNLNLHIRPGEKVALVGHSGSGKTTIVKLLYRLYDVSFGNIKIDGIDIKDVEQESLRGEMSIVPQEAILFDDTLYNNILFSNPSASREQVMRAIRFAQLDKFIQKLPKGEKTIVGQRGIKLSGGEKQRVSIARAILADKKILLLDEATSSLDSYTEHEIQKDLWELMKSRTSIIIAHRLSTIMHADRIVVMDKGNIVQIGKHRELIRQQGVYRKLWDLQKGGYIGE